MTDSAGIDWEDAFSNAAYIPDGMSFPEIWTARAAEFRARTSNQLDISYGENPREKFDLFFPTGLQKGLAVFVHGGYWLDFDKSSWSDLAEGALKHGWTVAIPSYPLAPEVEIPEITRRIAGAISAAAKRIEGPIRLVGHSAGGHLVTRMVCENSALPAEVAARIQRVVSISGVHDLRPLLLHSMNQRLGLNSDCAVEESPALCLPISNIELVAWVGALERPEFLRQSALLTEAWGRKGLRTRLVADPARHHFDVVDGLKVENHPLTLAFAGN